MLGNDTYYSNRKEPARISQGSLTAYTIALGAAVFLRCIGAYLLADQLRNFHIMTLLCLLEIIMSIFLLPLQKPCTNPRNTAPINWLKVMQLGTLRMFEQTFFLYGITLCGPLRSLLIYGIPSTVIVAALATAFRKTAPSASKMRGTIMLLIGFMAMIILDRDISADPPHAHQHQTGLNYVWHYLGHFIGLADHKGGVLLVVIALLMRTGYERAFKRLSVECGGAKRVNAATHLCSAIVTTPLAIIVTFFGDSINDTNSNGFLMSVVHLVIIALFTGIVFFYTEQAAHAYLDHNTITKESAEVTFVCAIILAYLKYGMPKHSHSDLSTESTPTRDHVLSPGVLITVAMFSGATFVLTSATVRKANAHLLDGWDITGKPLIRYGEDFLRDTSLSLTEFAKNTMANIWAKPDSRRIFYFLCLNLVFCGVEFLYGIWTNSLGLVSDAFHMLFDCLSLVMGLVAAVMANWKASGQFTYGYGRVEVLSGFINGLFLIVIAFAILMEAVGRLLDPPNIHTDKLMLVSVAGLIVNLFGIMAFHGSHGHSHGGGGDHGHSHGGSNANMYGVYLHILSDTGGSVAVIVSTLLIQKYGWLWVDPFCSLLLAIMIIISVVPLLKDAAAVLLQLTPDEMTGDLEGALDEILRLDGILSYSEAHCWQLKSDVIVASIHVQVRDDTNIQALNLLVEKILLDHGATQATVQIEAERFFQKIHSLYPSYVAAERKCRPMSQNVMTQIT